MNNHAMSKEMQYNDYTDNILGVIMAAHYDQPQIGARK